MLKGDSNKVRRRWAAANEASLAYVGLATCLCSTDNKMQQFVPKNPGQKRCQECRDDDKNRQNDVRARWKKHGLCIRCRGKEWRPSLLAVEYGIYGSKDCIAKKIKENRSRPLSEWADRDLDRALIAGGLFAEIRITRRKILPDGTAPILPEFPSRLPALLTNQERNNISRERARRGMPASLALTVIRALKEEEGKKKKVHRKAKNTKEKSSMKGRPKSARLRAFD
jgi:hypothetical protein